MLTRIYGTAFYSQKELTEYLQNLEEAKKRDHRKLGAQLEIFSISEEVGQGLILWLPKGQIIKEELENWGRATEKKWGYQHVSTPNIGKTSLYKTSGHLPYYKKDMYPIMKGEKGEAYILKPMNCPHHHQIYKSKPRSYKELPLRLAEFGTCYRYEASGELFGLMRVRGFTQNDSHIYCTEKQAVEEFVSVMKLHQYYYQQLGITNYHLELALRDPHNKKKYSGNDTMWAKAEKLMRLAVKQVKIPMVISIGNAAFYGPKIDFIITSSIGREFAISTNQIDLFMGERFGLKYTDSNGSEKTPVIIHRAPLGSHERFIGFLIEHFAGNFPTWLTPVQVKILPISAKQNNYAQKIFDQLKENNIRAELDDRAESLGTKIRSAQMEKVSYMLILGKQEQQSKTLAVRNRAGKQSKLDLN
ncbi:MAG: threonine--tRNA ligase, partial [Patescibacteria group bacterium]|nr:threonine--tRNA ligase [Patescibacteria group bacterium]